MAQAQPGQPLVDGISTLGDGVDTSVPARRLAKTQLSRAQNVGLRTEFATHRNVFKKVQLDFGGDPLLPDKLKNVRWQKGVYYEADTGPEAMVTVIGGRLFRWDPGPEQAPIQTLTCKVSEVTATFQTQVTAGFTVPAVGLSSAITITVVSTTGFNVCTTIEVGVKSFGPLNPPPAYWYPGDPSGGPNALAGHHYHITAILSDTEMTIENLDDTPGNIIPAGAAVIGYDPNPPNRKAWLCQAEKWVVWTDGQSPTVFYDGVSSRRSIGMKFITDPLSPKTLAVVAFTSPKVGETVKVSVGDSIDFDVQAAIKVGTADYTVTAVDVTSVPPTITLSNTNDAVGTVYPIGTEILWPQVLDASELPPGRMMAYGKGRLAMAGTDGKTFLFSDLVGDSSGTQAENRRDAVLKIRDSNQLTGGRFRIPGTNGDISALIYIPMLDVSLGQGPLQIHTTRKVFNCNLPTDARTWQDQRTAILTETDSSYGSLSQESVIPVNGDIHYRNRTGIESYVTRRRDFLQWGTTPISTEVDYYLNDDDQELLNVNSQIVFDNRRLTTCSPVSSPYGIYHRGIISMDLNPLGSNRNKKLADYEGLWQDAAAQGLRLFQLIVGEFRGVERAYFFALGNDNEIELYEILPEAIGINDNDGERIKSVMEYSTMFDDGSVAKRTLKRLVDGEVVVENVIGPVTFEIFYRPEEYSVWTPWHSWSICANLCPPTTPCLPSANYRPQHRSRMGLGEPSFRTCDAVNNKPLREGYYFHVRVEITGHCQLTGLALAAVNVPEPKMAPLVCKTEPCYIATADCDQIRPPFA